MSTTMTAGVRPELNTGSHEVIEECALDVNIGSPKMIKPNSRNVGSSANKLLSRTTRKAPKMAVLTTSSSGAQSTNTTQQQSRMANNVPQEVYKRHFKQIN